MQLKRVVLIGILLLSGCRSDVASTSQTRDDAIHDPDARPAHPNAMIFFVVDSRRSKEQLERKWKQDARSAVTGCSGMFRGPKSRLLITAHHCIDFPAEQNQSYDHGSWKECNDDRVKRFLCVVPNARIGAGGRNQAHCEPVQALHFIYHPGVDSAQLPYEDVAAIRWPRSFSDEGIEGLASVELSENGDWSKNRDVTINGGRRDGRWAFERSNGSETVVKKTLPDNFQNAITQTDIETTFSYFVYGNRTDDLVRMFWTKLFNLAPTDSRLARLLWQWSISYENGLGQVQYGDSGGPVTAYAQASGRNMLLGLNTRLAGSLPACAFIPGCVPSFNRTDEARKVWADYQKSIREVVDAQNHDLLPVIDRMLNPSSFDVLHQNVPASRVIIQTDGFVRTDLESPTGRWLECVLNRCDFPSANTSCAESCHHLIIPRRDGSDAS